METVLPGVSYLDCVDRLLYPQELSKPDYLPILAHSALEQILSPSSSEESSCSSSSSGFSEMERMSPDSTVNPVLTLTQNDASMVGFGMVTTIEQPDSTTNDLNSYDSDAFDSEDSVSSFAEVQEAAAASGMMWPSVEKPHQECEGQQRVHRRERRSTSSSSSGSYSEPLANRNFGNALTTQKSSTDAKPPKKKKTKRQESTVLKCQCCEYTTRYKEHLSSHMNTHASNRNYMCSDCGQTFKWSHSLKRHQRTHQTHPDFRYTCHFCFKTFSRKDHLTIHEDLHTTSGETFPCGQCGATFKNRKTLTGHMKTHTSQKDFKCNECDSEFTRRASLNRHIRAAHAGQVITCPLCPAVFSYRSTLEDHKKAAHNEGKREFGCSLCGVQFAVKAYLSKHMVTCRNRAVGRSYECNFCTKCFPTVRHLNEHSKRKHPAVSRQPNFQRLKAEAKAPGLLAPEQVQEGQHNLHQSQQVQLLPQIQQLHSQPQQQILTQQPLEPQPSQSLQQPQTMEKYQPVFMEIPNQVPQHESSDIILCQPPQSQQQPHQISQVPNFQMNSPHQQIQDCYMFSNTSANNSQSRSDVPMIANTSSMAGPDEENVGSLLRLVYGCSDQSVEQDSNNGFVVTDQTSQYHYNNQNPPNMNQISQTFYKQPDNNILDYQSFEGISLDYMKNYFVTISYDSFE